MAKKIKKKDFTFTKFNCKAYQVTFKNPVTSKEYFCFVCVSNLLNDVMDFANPTEKALKKLAKYLMKYYPTEQFLS